MSHYVVMVIGEDVDGKLAPYNEDTTYLHREDQEFIDVEAEHRDDWKANRLIPKQRGSSDVNVSKEQFLAALKGGAPIEVEAKNPLDSSLYRFSDGSTPEFITLRSDEILEELRKKHKIHKKGSDNTAFHRECNEKHPSIVARVLDAEFSPKTLANLARHPKCPFTDDEKALISRLEGREESRGLFLLLIELMEKYPEAFQIGGGVLNPGSIVHKITVMPLEDNLISLHDKYKTFNKFMEEYAGMEADDEGRYGYLTNPKGKWDCYQIGGRWAGYFLGKPGVEGVIGDAGLTTNPPPAGYFDSLLKGEVDTETMLAEVRKRANATYDEYKKVTSGMPIPTMTWDELKESVDSIKEARTIRNTDPWIKALRAANLLGWSSDPVTIYGRGREAYLEAQANSFITPYAVIHEDGTWEAQGDMGWFGMSNDNDEVDWDKRFMEIWDSIPDDMLVTAVDCHS